MAKLPTNALDSLDFDLIRRAVDAIRLVDLQAINTMRADVELAYKAFQEVGPTAHAAMKEMRTAKLAATELMAMRRAIANEGLLRRQAADIFTASGREFLASIRFTPDAASTLVGLDIASAVRAFDWSWLQIGRTVSTNYDALLRGVFADVRNEIDTLRPIIEQYQRELSEATTPEEQRLTFRSTAQAVFKGATGIQTRLNTPAKKLEFYVAVVFLLLQLWSAYVVNQRLASLEVEQARQRVIDRQRAEEIAVFTETLHAVQRELKILSVQPDVTLRIRRKTVLREGPSGATHLVAPLTVGQTVKWISTYERWSYVEVLDGSGRGSGVRGWLYRRSLRLNK